MWRDAVRAGHAGHGGVVVEVDDRVAGAGSQADQQPGDPWRQAVPGLAVGVVGGGDPPHGDRDPSLGRPAEGDAGGGDEVGDVGVGRVERVDGADVDGVDVDGVDADVADVDVRGPGRDRRRVGLVAVRAVALGALRMCSHGWVRLPCGRFRVHTHAWPNQPPNSGTHPGWRYPTGTQRPRPRGGRPAAEIPIQQLGMATRRVEPPWIFRREEPTKDLFFSGSKGNGMARQRRRYTPEDKDRSPGWRSRSLGRFRDGPRSACTSRLA